jgi:hypothetical protein
MSQPQRTVFVEDAVGWLQRQPVMEGCSVFTSMPDVSELSPMTLPDWKRWTVDTAALVLDKTPDDGVAIIYQTDIKVDRLWIDKAHLAQCAADRTGHNLLWHKVVCRFPAGNISYGRPAYSHVLCFSRSIKPDLARSTPDVLPALGHMTWSRAMGLHAARMAVKFIATHTRSHTVVDPFCGVGTALAVANEAGLHAIGVELSRKRAQKSRNLDLQKLETHPPDAEEDPDG